MKVADLAWPGAVECRTLSDMAMGKRAARQASPMWVDTADLPTSDGHPFFERLNRALEDCGFDAFVEELCATFYADRLGRPSLERLVQDDTQTNRTMTEEQRKAISERMRQYWASRRKRQGAQRLIIGGQTGRAGRRAERSSGWILGSARRRALPWMK